MAMKWTDKEIKLIVKHLDEKPKNVYEKFTNKFGKERSYKSVASKQDSLKKALFEASKKEDIIEETINVCDGSAECKIKTKINNVKSQASEFITEAKTKADELMVEAKTKVDPLVKQAEDLINETKEKIKSVDIDFKSISNNFNGLFSKLEEATSKMESKFETLIEKTETKFETLVEKTESTIKETLNKFKSEKNGVTDESIVQEPIVEETIEEDCFSQKELDDTKLKAYKDMILEMKSNDVKTKDILEYLLYNTNLNKKTTKDDVKKFIKKHTKEA